eukprot:NODE_63_length_26141_cov_1.022656.p17 type:complete len:193 gc:universal NODE_63_length_26141_cov_1.022656:2972-3550(+)
MVTKINSFIPKISPELCRESNSAEDSLSCYINSGFLSNCHGSCLLENGPNLLIARVIVHPVVNKSEERFVVEFKENAQLSHVIRKALFPCIIFEQLPNTILRVQVEALSGVDSFHCINAVSLALVDANIPLLGIISAYQEETDNEKSLMVCCNDQITHFKLKGELNLFDQCFEGCQQVRKLIQDHIKIKLNC